VHKLVQIKLSEPCLEGAEIYGLFLIDRK